MSLSFRETGENAELGVVLIQVSEQPGALPMAVAFLVYGLAGAVLFLVGAVLHLLIRTGPRPR